jgi:membrane glycosyltransferase
MSNSSRPESLGEYLAHLPLTDEQRAELAGCTSFSELHQRLSAKTPTPCRGRPGLGGPRLTVSTAESWKRPKCSVSTAAAACAEDRPADQADQGRARAVAHQYSGAWLAPLTGRTNPPQPPKRECAAAARWRTVGSIRRYILLP